MLDHLNLAVLQLLAAAPTATPSGIIDPGRGAAPPGAEKLTTLLQWAAYVGYAVAVLGVIIAAATMAIQHRHGTAGDNGARLGWVLAGALLIGSASALVGAMA